MSHDRHVTVTTAGLGVLWALLAWSLGAECFRRGIVGGLLAAPFLGLLMGRLSEPLWRTGVLLRSLLCLASLYLAAFLFGVAVGGWDVWVGPGPRDSLEVIGESVFAATAGMTVSGFVVLFWPLTYLTHWCVVRLRNRDRGPGSSDETPASRRAGGIGPRSRRSCSG